MTTALPSPASVGARITPRITASLSEKDPNRSTATSPPSTTVSGRPKPSSRTGIEASRRSARRSTREESENNTTASVASAKVRTVELVGRTERSSSTSGPTSTPTAVTTIAGVTGVLDRRRDTAATSSNVRPMIASPEFTARPSRRRFPGASCATAHARGVPGLRGERVESPLMATTREACAAESDDSVPRWRPSDPPMRPAEPRPRHPLNDRDPAVTPSVLGCRVLTMLGDLLANLACRRAFKHRNAPFLSMTICCADLPSGDPAAHPRPADSGRRHWRVASAKGDGSSCSQPVADAIAYLGAGVGLDV